MQWTAADATFKTELSAALGGVNILIYPSTGEIQPHVTDDDLFFGKLAFGVRDSALRVEISLAHGACVHFDAWLAKRTGNPTYAALAMGGELRGVEIERPSELVIELMRRLAGTWLATAGGGSLADAVEWLPLGHDRHWFVRSLEFDGHLSQLLGEPMGSLQLLSPTPFSA